MGERGGSVRELSILFGLEEVRQEPGVVQGRHPLGARRRRGGWAKTGGGKSAERGREYTVSLWGKEGTERGYQANNEKEGKSGERQENKTEPAGRPAMTCSVQRDDPLPQPPSP